MARAGAGVVHNPLSNLKLKNGVAPLLDLKHAGVNLALGCDNRSCSDCQNLFQAMKPTPCRRRHGRRAVRRARAGCARGRDGRGARAVGSPAPSATCVPGCSPTSRSSICRSAYLPFNSAARQLVFSETGRGVHTVMVDGEVGWRMAA